MILMILPRTPPQALKSVFGLMVAASLVGCVHHDGAAESDLDAVYFDHASLDAVTLESRVLNASASLRHTAHPYRRN
jgi:hypothetical protein